MTVPESVREVVEDNLECLWREVPPGMPFGWILDGEDEDGDARHVVAYRDMEAKPACAWALGWLQGTAEALGMTRLELLDAVEINVGKIKL